LWLSLEAKAQQKQSLSIVIEQVSQQWKNDTSYCKGDRRKLSEKLLNSRIDTVHAEQIVSSLGRPDRIQKFYDGNAKKEFVGYSYFVFKDECLEIAFEAIMLQLVFNDSEYNLVKIISIEYCG
jgi:hypothetical protein